MTSEQAPAMTPGDSLTYDEARDIYTVRRMPAGFSVEAEAWAFALPQELNHLAMLIAMAPPPYQPLIDSAVDRYALMTIAAEAGRLVPIPGGRPPDRGEDEQDVLAFGDPEASVEWDEIHSLCEAMASALSTGASIGAAVVGCLQMSGGPT